jgi:predicted PurR-regulated permease PerM
VVIGNTLTVIVLGIVYANYCLFHAYVSSVILAVFVAEALAENRNRLVEWLTSRDPLLKPREAFESWGVHRQSLRDVGWTEQPLRGSHWPMWLLGCAALLLLALRVPDGFHMVLAGAMLVFFSGVFVLGATFLLVRARWIHARTAAAALLVAALIVFTLAAVLVFVTGILQDLVGAARALAHVAHNAARVKHIDPQGILAKAAEQLQMLLAPRVEAAERFALQFRDLAREFGVDLENPEHWWVKGSDPSWWRHLLAPDSRPVGASGNALALSLPSWPHFRAAFTNTWRVLRANLSPGSAVKFVRWARPHLQPEQILAGARLIMFVLAKLAQAMSVLLAYSDGTAVFLGMLFFLLRQPYSIMRPLMHWIPFRDPERNQRLERALHQNLHGFVWDTMERMWVRSLLVWCVFVAFALELEFLAALCTCISVLVPILPGPVFWCALYGLPQLMMRSTMSSSWRWSSSLAFMLISILAQKLLIRFCGHNGDALADGGESETALPQPGGLLTLSALLGWRIFGGFRGALIASCCIFLSLLTLHCILDDSRPNTRTKSEPDKTSK